MELGYKIDDSGQKIHATTIIPTRIKAQDVELLVNVNRDVSYPLNSPHNRGLHIKVRDKDKICITELNLEEITTEQELLTAVNEFFDDNDDYVMIENAAPGETFPYDSQVYNLTAINNHSYHGWDDDLEDLEDNADHQVTVFLNDNLRWQVK